MLAPILLTALLLAQTSPVRAASRAGATQLPFPQGSTQTINVVEWQANDLPRIYERSDQLPLSDEEVAKLSKAGFAPAQLVKMIEERRCACDASADGLIKLKQQGVHPDVLQAISLHGLRPNRGLNFLMTLDFVGQSRSAREAYLYVFIEDGTYTRVLTANLNELLSRRVNHDVTVDRSDIMKAREVRRVQLSGEVRLTTYGKHNVMVVSSTNPTLSHPTQLTELERQKAQSYTLDYPRASLQSVCNVIAGYRRDAVLSWKWHFQGSRFECEWN